MSRLDSACPRKLTRLGQPIYVAPLPAGSIPSSLHSVSSISVAVLIFVRATRGKGRHLGSQRDKTNRSCFELDRLKRSSA
jgi:hypothetical protein